MNRNLLYFLFFIINFSSWAESEWPNASVQLSNENYVLNGYSLKLPANIKIKSVHALTDVSLAVKYQKGEKLGITLLRNDGHYFEEFLTPQGVTLTRYFELLYSSNTEAFDKLSTDRRAFLPELTNIIVYETDNYKAISASIELESFNRRVVIFRKSDPNTVLDLLSSDLTSEQIQSIVSSFTYKGI